MLTVFEVDIDNARDRTMFLGVPRTLYHRTTAWVPPVDASAALAIDPRRHPFYRHSEAAFFVAVRDGYAVGRVGALDLRPYNRTRSARDAWFTLFDCADDPEAATALFGRVFEWATARGLSHLVGPRGLGPFDGYGVLIDGFDRRQLMTMSSYNGPWYSHLLEGVGFAKELDFVSYQIDLATFEMPEAVCRAARLGGRTMTTLSYSSTQALLQEATRIADVYNRSFASSWEFYPLAADEIDCVIHQIRVLIDSRLIAAVTRNDTLIGFLLGFPDISASLQQVRGRVTPIGAIRLLLERHTTRSMALNGIAVIPEYQRTGASALMYMHVEAAVRRRGFTHVELPQVADTARQMRRDIERFGATPIKTHRVYRRAL